MGVGHKLKGWKRRKEEGSGGKRSRKVSLGPRPRDQGPDNVGSGKKRQITGRERGSQEEGERDRKKACQRDLKL